MYNLRLIVNFEVDVAPVSGNLCPVLPGDTAYVMSGSLLGVRRSAVAVVGGLVDVSEAVAYYPFYGKALPFLGSDKGQNRISDDASDGKCVGP
jgi:hypothetical protein